MNRDISGASLGYVPNASRTLLFWQAVTSAPALPSSAYQQSTAGFGGVACDGRSYYLEPTGKADNPLIWHSAQRSLPPHEPIPK